MRTAETNKGGWKSIAENCGCAEMREMSSIEKVSMKVMMSGWLMMNQGMQVLDLIYRSSFPKDFIVF